MIPASGRTDLCRKRGASDRHGRPFWAGQSLHLGPELMRERFDDTRAEPGLCLSKDAVRPANPVVGDRKLPIHLGSIISDGYLIIALALGERMLQSIHYQLCDDQAEALGLTGSRTSCLTAYLQRDWPNVANHRGCE